MKRKTMKIGIVIMCLLVTTTLVGATLISYFGKVETTMNVAQSVQIDGKNWDEIIAHDIPNAVGGCCYCFEHSVKNSGCESIDLTFTEYGTPNLVGIDVMYKQKCYLSELVIDVLDGIADDSFDVYVDGTLVLSYINGDPIVDPEAWQTHTIDLTSHNIPCYGTHTIEIDATGPAWASQATYGQLAVDTISLYCGEGNVLCDSVDIGDVTSEAGHNLVSWGPIEPATSGGDWGGFGASGEDCRVTWEPSGSIWAKVDLTCNLCDKPELVMPFTIESGETLDFYICYELDMLIAPGDYAIYHKLVPN